jgi:predicted MFS family arabinose efflux permease
VRPKTREPSDEALEGSQRRRQAIAFVALLGVVSLFADMTYEAARSINGPYLALLGAGSLAVGIIAGGGELLGYLIRLFSGTVVDRQHAYWLEAIIGYCINLFSVPALALAGNWPAAAALMVAERIGKGLRNPPRDVMLSAAGSAVGQGRVFGFHEAMDQIGATLGPLIVAAVLALRGGYKRAYGLLLIPATIAVLVVIAGRLVFPRPERFEAAGGKVDRGAVAPQRFPSTYWIYLAGMMLVAAGFADFPLIAFHFAKADIAAPSMIAVLYAVAMGVDALSALLLGALLDRIGAMTMVAAVAIALFFGPLVFAIRGAGSLPAAFAGMALWGIGMGAHESVMGAIVARIVPFRSRGRAYGLFNAGYGAAWFAGSALLGYLYGVSIPGLVAFSMAIQALSLPLLIAVARRFQASSPGARSS